MSNSNGGQFNGIHSARLPHISTLYMPFFRKPHSSVNAVKHNFHFETLASANPDFGVYRFCRFNFDASNPCSSIEKSALVISTLAAADEGNSNLPFSRRLYQMAYPSLSQYSTFTQSCALFRNTNKCPDIGSASSERRTTSAKLSNDLRMSTGTTQK